MPIKGSAAERLSVILICFGYLTLGSVLSVVAGERKFDYTNDAVLWMLAIELTLGFAAILFLRQRGWTLSDFGFDVSRRATIGAVALYLGTNLACAIAYLPVFRSGMLAGWEEAPVNFAAAPALMLLFLVVNSVFEELFVVGYIIEATPANEAAFAVSVSALVRFLYHTYQGPVAFATILPLGVIFAAVYWKWRNLWPLVLAHTAMNILGWATT